MKNILLICGTLAQTRAMLAVGAQLHEYRCFYSPFYADGLLRWAGRRGWLNFTPLGDPLRERTLRCLREAGVPIDHRGEGHYFDLVVTCTDLVVQRNIRGRRVVLIQEGLTEPEGLLYLGARYLKLPRYLANTSAFGLSGAYDAFCVASSGYRDVFRRKGVPSHKMIVTGVPHLDNMEAHRDNTFPDQDYVLICTSNARETFKWDNRRRFLRQAMQLAEGRPVIVKLHPAERHSRAMQEVQALAPGARVLAEGNTEHMIANASMVIAQYSTVAFTAAALGKELYSYLEPAMIRSVLPLQNGGRSAIHIAEVCRRTLVSGPAALRHLRTALERPTDRVPDMSRLRLMPR